MIFHKLIGFSAVVYLAIFVYPLYQPGQIITLGILAIILTLLFLIGLFATGGFLSAEGHAPRAVSMIHEQFPYLTVLFSGGMIYLLA